MPNIDAHAHVSAPAALWAWKAGLVASRGSHGRTGPKMSDDELRAAYDRAEIGPLSHNAAMHRNHIDVQLLSPRPFQLMNSEKFKLVDWFTQEVNDVIYRSTQLFADRFFGVCALPQAAGEPIEKSLPELQRCITELGFVGTLLNPDPYENGAQEAPGLGERYWYPLYEKLCELDVPALIHGTASLSDRTPYSVHFINEETIAVYNLVNSDVFRDFPTLKIVVSHGGGAIPYQLGRFESTSMRRPEGRRFRDGLRHLYFDTVLYTEGALRLLVDEIGSERLLYGSECPGVGSAIDPHSGSSFDDIIPHIEKLEMLSAEQKRDILENNARRLYRIPAAKPALVPN